MIILRKFNLGILSCIIAGLVVISDLFHMFNLNQSTDFIRSLGLVLLTLLCISLGIIYLLKIKIGDTCNRNRIYYILAGLFVVFNLFYMFNQNPSMGLMYTLKIFLLNLLGIALGIIGLLKIKITGNGNRKYYIVGCILNLLLIIRYYVNGFILLLFS